MRRDRSGATAYVKLGIMCQLHCIMPGAVGARRQFGRIIAVRPPLNEMRGGIDADALVPFATAWPITAVVHLG